MLLEVLQYVRPNATDAETTNAQSITAFSTDGFTYGTLGDIAANGNVCSWNWKAANAQGSSNTDGSINTTHILQLTLQQVFQYQHTQEMELMVQQ